MERRTTSRPVRPDAAPRRRSRSPGGERGSVLMEGVLVLPLYLMALGALFIIGDLARSRLMLLSMERSVTWLARDRFPSHGDDEMGKMLMAFMDSCAYKPGTVPWGTVHEAIKGGQWLGNRWMNGYMGFMVVPVEVPFWYGMANAEAVMDSRGAQDGDDEFPFKDSYVLPAGSDGKGGAFWRSYVVRRRPDEAGERYDRNADARTLVGGVWFNVFNEPWIVGGNGEEGYHPLPEPKADSGVAPYQRLEELIGMAE